MADKNVKLNYVPVPGMPANTASLTDQGGNQETAHFVADPASTPLKVRGGQTISFQLGSAPPHGKIRIKFAEPRFFSTSRKQFKLDGIHEDADGDVKVEHDLPPGTRTSYHCMLFVDGHLTAESREGNGGDVVPDSGA
jgi:hypothetical protein